MATIHWIQVNSTLLHVLRVLLHNNDEFWSTTFFRNDPARIYLLKRAFKKIEFTSLHSFTLETWAFEELEKSLSSRMLFKEFPETNTSSDKHHDGSKGRLWFRSPDIGVIPLTEKTNWQAMMCIGCQYPPQRIVMQIFVGNPNRCWGGQNRIAIDVHMHIATLPACNMEW